jgi:hypothetical protein
MNRSKQQYHITVICCYFPRTRKTQRRNSRCPRGLLGPSNDSGVFKFMWRAVWENREGKFDRAPCDLIRRRNQPPPQPSCNQPQPQPATAATITLTRSVFPWQKPRCAIPPASPPDLQFGYSVPRGAMFVSRHAAFLIDSLRKKL